MFEITDGYETIETDSRDEALEAAHELSDGNHKTVIAESDEERLMFKNGTLEQYIYDTRRRR